MTKCITITEAIGKYQQEEKTLEHYKAARTLSPFSEGLQNKGQLLGT